MRAQRSEHYASIEIEQQKLRELRALYDSLQRFQAKVKLKNGDFFSANKNKKTHLEELDPIQDICKSAEKYNSGETVVLDGIGSKIVYLSLINLVVKILVKLADYQAQIDACNASIRAHRQRIEELNDEIREAKREKEREAEERAERKRNRQAAQKNRNHFS